MKIQKPRFVSLAVATLMTAMAATALAQSEPPPAAPPPGEAPAASPASSGTAPVAMAASESKMRLGLNVVPMPFGTLKFSALGISASEDTAFAFGIMPFFDYLVTRNFFVGLGPMYTLNVKGKSGDSAAKELDLQVRIGGTVPVSDQVDIYGYVSPGYSIVMPPTGNTNAKGFEVGFHAGGMFNLSSLLFLNAEVGYQVGFQKVTEGGQSADLKPNYFQIGLGGGVHL